MLLSFQSFVAEAQSQQGFQYEEHVAEFLKTLGFVPKDFKPASAASDRPDLILQVKGKKAGVELKISDASAGSLALQYNPDAKQHWGFGDVKGVEKEFLASIAEKSGMLKLINDRWSAVPAKHSTRKTGATRDERMAEYTAELEKYPDIRVEIDPKTIEQYYNHKDCTYVNIGTHGFYLLGPSNPLKLAEVPRFSDAAKTSARARVQYKGSGKYQFVFEFSFRIPLAKRSPFNIAPVLHDSVNIDTEAVNLPF